MPKKSPAKGSSTTRTPSGKAKVASAAASQPARQPAATIGTGGELHQPVQGGQVLTSAQGAPLSDDQNSLRAGRARTHAAGGPRHAREDLPLRPRAHPRAGRARPRLRRTRHLRDHCRPVGHHQGRHLRHEGHQDRGLRPLLDRGGRQGFLRPRTRRTWLRGEALHDRGQLGHRRQQHPGVLHPGRHQVPRPGARGQGGAGPGLPAGAVGPRQLLGLRVLHARGDPHDPVADVGPGDPAVLPLHGGLRGPHLPLRQRRRASRPS